MKIPKEARKISRSLFRSSFTDGRLDAGKVREVVAQTVATKPRHYIEAIKNLQRLVRMELAKRHAIIESATPLDGDVSGKVVADLKARYGSDITTEFAVNPELLGGLRIKLGSDVWDGSVRGRLTRFEENLAQA